MHQSVLQVLFSLMSADTLTGDCPVLRLLVPLLLALVLVLPLLVLVKHRGTDPRPGTVGAPARRNPQHLSGLARTGARLRELAYYVRREQKCGSIHTTSMPYLNLFPSLG